MYKLTIALVSAMLILGLGCVIRTEHTITAEITLNIRQIGAQADDILDVIEGVTDKLSDVEGIGSTSDASSTVLGDFLQEFSPMQIAYAVEIKETNSPLIKEIVLKLRDRNDAIVALKKKGCFGETNRAYIELRDCAEQADAEKKNDAQKVLAEENKDRKALYREIARINKEDDLSIAKVESIHALRRLQRAKKKEVFELPPAGEDFEAVKKSILGQKLGSKAKPGAWIVIP